MSEETETDLVDEHIQAHISEDVDENQSDENIPDDSDSKEEAPKKSRNQNAKARLKRKLHDEQERNALAEEENRKLKEKFTALEQKVDGVINPPEPRPNRVDYETEEIYEDELFKWNSSQSVVQPESVDNPAVAPQPEGDFVPEKTRENWDDQFDKGLDKYGDFREIISNPRLRMTDAMSYAVMESESGGEIAYFLGKNPQEADRIAGMTTTAQIREIDKISSKFKKNQTNAPDPITPIGGKGEADSKQVHPLLEGATFT